MHRTVVESLEDLTGGGYGKMRNATFNQVKVTTHNRDGSIHELHLPAHRQASAFRMDMAQMAKRDGDLQMRSCWLQFLTLRVSPPAHPETMPRRAGGRREEETHIVKQRGQQL